MPQVQLTLGDITFASFEVPESLPFGGKQSLTVHKFIGGKRVVDSMGKDDKPLAWKGLFLGANALDRALYLNTQRILGQKLTLTMSQLRYLVVIEEFEPDYEFQFRIPYSISCVVVEDQTNQITSPPAPDIDDQMNNDLVTAVGLAAIIQDGGLTSLMGVLSLAVAAVPTFANASSSVTQSVLQPLGAVETLTQSLWSAQIANTQGSVLGGVASGASSAISAAALTAQVLAFNSQPALSSLIAVTGRMSANLANVSGNSSSVTTAGGNLFTMAAAQYGDATSWTAIAKANGLTDPILSGVQTVVVPSSPDSTPGGVLGI